MNTIQIDKSQHFIARVSDLLPGSVLASGHVVESVATGGLMYGPEVLITFTDGLQGRGGNANRIWVRSL